METNKEKFTSREKDAWDMVYEEICNYCEDLAIRNAGCPDPFFRGHAQADWVLKPNLGRIMSLSKEELNDMENRIYSRFVELGGHLLPDHCDKWDILFFMQHHGLPTRLLDWTENFAVALYFATHCATDNAAVWILNPYALNYQTANKDYSIFNLSENFTVGYVNYFIDGSKKNKDFDTFPHSAIAIEGSTKSERMRSQRSVFTFHNDLQKPIDELCGDIKKIILPKEALPGARRFLKYAGINEFSIFPDLDGLARLLTIEEC